MVLFNFFERLIIISWAIGIFSIGTYLKRSPLSINNALEFLAISSRLISALLIDRRDLYVTVLYKQTSDNVPGEFLGRLVLGVEDDEIKVFGATIY